jgi:hypothetical protein
VKIEFSELALAGIRREILDESSQKTCVVHLSFYLRRDYAERAENCPAFPDRDLYLYAFGVWRVLFAIEGDRIVVWSFLIEAQ